MATKTHQSRSNRLPIIKPVQEVDNPKSYVIWGRQGTGKTTLVATFPKPLLLLDFNDRGTDSITKTKGIDVAEIREIREVEALYWMLEKGKHKYKTVAFDTVTGMQAMMIEEITGEKDNAKWGALTRQEYGEVSSELKSTFLKYRDLDMEVAFLAQQRLFNISDEDNMTDAINPEMGPRLIPSAADALNSAVNVIGQTYIRNKVTKKKIGNRIEKTERIQYCLLVGPDPIRITKIRKNKSQVPLSSLIDPTYEDLIDIISGD